MSISVGSHLCLKIAIRHVSRFNHALLSPSLCTSSSSSSSSSHVPPPNSSRSLTSICHSAILHMSCLPSHMFALLCSHSPRLTCAIFTSSCLLELSVECFVVVFFLFLFRSVIEGGGAYEIHKSFIRGVVIVHQEERKKIKLFSYPIALLVYFYLFKCS